jgi:membrane peptidoglycan carboxypeptidase
MTEVKHTPGPPRQAGHDEHGHDYWHYGDLGPRRPYFSDVYWPGVLSDAAYVCAFFVLALLASAFLVYWAYTYDLKPPDQALAEAGIGSSAVFDRSGTTHLYQFSDPLHGVRNPVSLSEMSPYLVAATIATEDPSFYGNPGVNFRGLARAAFENLTPFGPGFFAGSGGSSITQQLARNVYVDPAERSSRSILRKAKETSIALELKQEYSDDQILEWYLNQVYYGNSAYGAEAASQRYFGKSAKDLSLAEAALLAGLPQAPAEYSPAVPENQERAKGRQLQVLDLMIDHSSDIEDIVQVSPEEIEAAKQEPLNYAANQFDVRAPHFVFFVEDQVAKMCAKGLFKPPHEISCDSVIGLGALRITTTLDYGLQQIGERVLEEELAASEERSGGHNGSIVAIHPESGQILAYVGSRAYFREDINGQVDIASSLQSHGSSMKAFTYLTAFEQGWVPSTFIEDKPLTLVEGDPTTQVNNWNSRHLGRITVRKAISESVNTAAVRTVMEVGVDPMRATAQRVGITDLQADTCGPAITLGSCEVKLVDMTYAYSTFANNGVMRGRPTSEELPSGFRELDPVSVLKIEDTEGNVLYEYTQPEERKVTEPAYAFMLTDVLSKDAIRWSELTFDRPAAVKTGTSEEFRDNVVMGYTRDIATGVWVGNADDTPMAPGTFSSSNSGPIWKRFMQEAHTALKLAPRPFEKPADVTTQRCGGVVEVFKQNQKPSKPGACNPGSDRGPAPSPGPPPEETPPPPPESTPVQTAPPATPEPSAPPPITPEPSPTPKETPVETPTPEPTPAAPLEGGGGGPAP